MPNAKFPMKAFKEFSIPKEKFLPGLVVTEVGNSYSASSLVGLTAILDIAKPGQRILLTSYGSGAGGDSFSLKVTDKILEIRDKAPLTKWYIDRKTFVDYGTYLKLRGKIAR